MAEALKAKDIHGLQARRVEERRRATQALALRDKTFEQLSSDDKDVLLKEVAIRLGLILPSPLAGSPEVAPTKPHHKPRTGR